MYERAVRGKAEAADAHRATDIPRRLPFGAAQPLLAVKKILIFGENENINVQDNLSSSSYSFLAIPFSGQAIVVVVRVSIQERAGGERR